MRIRFALLAIFVVAICCKCAALMSDDTIKLRESLASTASIRFNRNDTSSTRRLDDFDDSNDTNEDDYYSDDDYDDTDENDDERLDHDDEDDDDDDDYDDGVDDHENDDDYDNHEDDDHHADDYDDYYDYDDEDDDHHDDEYDDHDDEDDDHHDDDYDDYDDEVDDRHDVDDDYDDEFEDGYEDDDLDSEEDEEDMPRPSIGPLSSPSREQTARPTIYEVTFLPTLMPTPDRHLDSITFTPTRWPTPSPSRNPSQYPTLAPTARPLRWPTTRAPTDALTSQPLALPTTSRDVHDDDCTDDWVWAKNNDPSKDCVWLAGKPSARCFVFGADGRRGYEACLCQCSDFTPLPSVIPTFIIKSATPTLRAVDVQPTTAATTPTLLQQTISPTLSHDTARPISSEAAEESLEPTVAVLSQTKTVTLSTGLIILNLDAGSFRDEEVSDLERTILSALDDEASIDNIEVVTRRRLRRLDEDLSSIRIRFVAVYEAVPIETSADVIRDFFVFVMTSAINDDSLDAAMRTSDSTLRNCRIDKTGSLALIADTVVIQSSGSSPPTASDLDGTDGGSSSSSSNNRVVVVIAILLTVCLMISICVALVVVAVRREKKRRSTRYESTAATSWRENRTNSNVSSHSVNNAEDTLALTDDPSAAQESKDAGLPYIEVLPHDDDDDGRARIVVKSEIEKKKIRESNWGKYRMIDLINGSVLWSRTNNEENSYVRNFGMNDGGLDFVSAESSVGWLTPSGNLIVSDELGKDLEKTLARSFSDRMNAFRHQVGTLRLAWNVGRVSFKVRRSNIVGDAYASLLNIKDPIDWRKPFFISFDGEVALDAGGCSREFFQSVTKELFDVSNGLFTYASGYSCQIANDTDSSLVYPDELEERYLFVGHIIGKALLEGHLIGAHPSTILLKHIVAEPLVLGDVQALDYGLWKSLELLKRMSAEEIDALELTFAVQHVGFGQSLEKELVAGGADIEVTKANLKEFLHLRFRERVLDTCRIGLSAFLKGIYEVVPLEYLLLLSSRELELALCGVPEICVDDWKAATQYRGEFAQLGHEHLCIRLFWEMLAGWSNDKRARLLQWCTGTSSVPAQGFNYLQGRDGEMRAFTLTSVSLDLAVYPRSHTCFNRIDLPLFEDRRLMADAFDFVLTPAFSQAFSMD